MANYNYQDRTSKEFQQADRNINKSITGQDRFALMRNSIPSDIIPSERVKLWINSLLDDQKTRDLILEKLPIQHIESNVKANEKQAEEVAALKSWLIEKKKERTYSLNREDIFADTKTLDKYQKLMNIVRNFDERDVALNNIFELAVADVWEYLLKKSYSNNSLVKDTKLYTTNEHDDVMAKTDFIGEVDYGTGGKIAFAYDLTISENEDEIQSKAWPKRTICSHFNISKNKDADLAIPRYVLEIEKELAFKYFAKYMNKMIEKKGHITPNDAHEIFQSIEGLRIKRRSHERQHDIKSSTEKKILEAVA